jgi:hypothetical protein
MSTTDVTPVFSIPSYVTRILRACISHAFHGSGLVFMNRHELAPLYNNVGDEGTPEQQSE